MIVSYPFFYLTIMWKKFCSIIEKPFLVISSLCSILSIVLLCFKTQTGVTIAAISLALSLIILLIAIVRVLNRFLEKDTAEDHRCIANFIRYKTNDGENIEFESYKLIQVKCSIMQYFETGFKWTGKNFPKVHSELQDVVFSKQSESADEYDTAKLKLREPALYSQTKVIHFKTTTNDAARISKPKVEVCVKSPIEFIQINISLGYKDSSFNKTAKIERARWGTNMPQRYELLGSIPFDSNLKQYSHSFINPEPGYLYKISWER